MYSWWSDQHKLSDWLPLAPTLEQLRLASSLEKAGISGQWFSVVGRILASQKWTGPDPCLPEGNKMLLSYERANNAPLGLVHIRKVKYICGVGVKDVMGNDKCQRMTYHS